MDHLSIIERVKLPTPLFFRRLQLSGLMLTAMASVLLTTPISLPELVLTIARYIAVIGAVVGGVSQVAVKN